LTLPEPERGLIPELKSTLAATLASVDGWLDDETAWVLHELARCSESDRADFTVVEIGCWKGRTTIAIALGLRARGGGTLYAVDPHTGSDQTIHLHGNVDTYDEFCRNIRFAHVEDYVQPIRRGSHEACRDFWGGKVDMLMVDASRQFDDIVEYIDDWRPLLAGTAVVGFRDGLDIYPALKSRLLKPTSGFQHPHLLDDSSGELLLLEGGEPESMLRHKLDLMLLSAQHQLQVCKKGRVVTTYLPHSFRTVLDILQSSAASALSGRRSRRYTTDGAHRPTEF
jgi:hypothetical protein